MIKTNEICQQSGVFLWEKFQKNFERISSHHWSDMSNVPYKVRVNRINIVWVLLLLSVPKKGKEALRTRLSGSKLTWTETFVRSIKFTKWKTTLNWGILDSYENLPIKTTLKKVQFFVCVTVTFLSPKSVASGNYSTFLQITQKTLITDTCWSL